MKYLNLFNENVTGTMSVADKMEKAKKAYDLQSNIWNERQKELRKQHGVGYQVVFTQ